MVKFRSADVELTIASDLVLRMSPANNNILEQPTRIVYNVSFEMGRLLPPAETKTI